MKPSRLLPLLLGAVLAASAPLLAVGGGEEEPTPPELQFKVSAQPSPLPSPGQGALRVEIAVPTGYHIFAAEGLSVGLDATGGLAPGVPRYPRGTVEEDQPVLRGKVLIEVPVTVPPGLKDKVKGSLTVNWQGCQDFGQKVCFLPTRDKVPFEIPVASVAQAAQGTQGPGPEVNAPAEPPAPPAVAPPPPEPSGFQERFADAAKNNIPLALLLAFVFGILSSLTPCVYPVIPITVAYIGSRSEGRGKAHGFLLSLAFVLGLALVYAALGAISAKAGQAFGALTQTPWVGIPIALLFFALSLSMFNLFEFKVPAGFANRIEKTKHRGKGRGFGGALLIGALSGLVASPCIGPLILAILVVVASTGSVLLGFTYLFTFALGMGVLFVVIGTFSGILASLPRSGGWMDGVRVFFGAIILGAAFYFGSLYLPRTAFLVASLLALWAVVLFLLFGAKRHFFPVSMRALGIVLSAAALAGVFLLLPAKGESGGAAWQTDLPGALGRASSLQKPALLDFRADWCVACVELEKRTWPDAGVQKLLDGTVPVKLDMTKNTEENRAIQARYRVMGLPTVILLDPQGKELGRFAGFKSPAEFLAWYEASAGTRVKASGR